MNSIKQLDIYGNELSKKEEFLMTVIAILLTILFFYPFYLLFKHIDYHQECPEYGKVKNLEVYSHMDRAYIYLLEDGRRISARELKSNGEQVCINWIGKISWIK